ncbi:DUF2254 domain-containing protein [Rhizobium rhizophilum]|uniref:DUF2254 domain-containing protein n=1 Tax=Rhizobium rhizophilum TaxID=1850373 RepID=A0ABY2QSW6_9HYPH|nr:DUF2254 domain-containing protein [Rhizobium rhizophilum]THV13448.1 DUF2254 domain-containing protein [Rhizobium rhizophilum]
MTHEPAISSRWRFILKQFSRRLWVRASAIGAIGVLAAVLATVAERFVPFEIPGSIKADSVDTILNIIASSMLAVTTFSLSAMTSAYASATSNVTPRATTLLVEDRMTQNVLSTFVGSFLYGIVGIVVLQTGAYGDKGRVILFVVTIGVIALIVFQLLRWIDHLTKLGRVGETTGRIEEAAARAIDARRQNPYLGGKPLAPGSHTTFADMIPVEAGAIGYVRHIDMQALSSLAESIDGEIHLLVNPGAFVYRDTKIAYLDAPKAEPHEDMEPEDVTRQSVTIGNERSFDQDPRFGLVVLSETAQRALSPAVNDPGTAIDVIGRATRLLSQWSEPAEDQEPQFPRVFVPALAADDLFEDAFMTIARDGAAQVEVQLRLQKSLAALIRRGSEDFRAAARRQAALALSRAEKALPIAADVQRLRDDLKD